MLSEVEFVEFQKENFSFLIDARSPREFLHSVGGKIKCNHRKIK